MFLAMERDEVLIHTTYNMDEPWTHYVCKRSQSQKTYCKIPFLWNCPEEAHSYIEKVDYWLPGAENGGGMQGITVNG